MKVVIPLAGKGTRLRPHTHVTPKPLLRVGDKPVMSYILDDLRNLGVNEAVFITGHLKERVEEYMAEEYADFKVEYVQQPVQNGTAGAVDLARPFVDEDLLIIFVDTLFDADLGIVRDLPDDVSDQLGRSLGELDRLVIPEQPRDVLAQQIVAEVAGRDWDETALFDLFRTAWPYRNLAVEENPAVVKMLADGYATRRGRRGARPHIRR